MTAPVILCMDTSGTRCDVALVQDSKALVQKTAFQRNAHSEKLMELIDLCLSETGKLRHHIEGVAVSIGPGSFTGLRVGLSAAKGLAMSLHIPILGIPTHDVVAEMLAPLPRLWVTNTAKRDHFYWTAYTDGRPDSACTIISSSELAKQIPFAGITLATDHPDWILARLDGTSRENIRLIDDSEAFPDATALGRLAGQRLKNGDIDAIESLVPIYVQSFQGVM